MKNESNLRPRSYSVNEVVRIINPKQMRYYLSKGIYPIDMYISQDDWDNQIVVYIFLKDETKELYQNWVNRNLV